MSFRRAVSTTLPALVAACTGPQSTFPGASLESGRIANLLLMMVAGSTAIVALVTGITVIALLGTGRWRQHIANPRIVVLGGIALPVVVLTALLLYGFVVLAERPALSRESIRISVVGEQWWWRVRYHDGNEVIETANELRLPVDRTVELELTSADVIHSFWVPALGGKIDMIPGHVNRLRLTPTETGTYRGQCAEYCGGPHALMSFFVVVETEQAFAEWLAAQRGGTASNDTAGRDLFLESGCGGCHAVRGTEAGGTIGPDLTHVGGRLTIGAGVLRTSESAFDEWIRRHHALKPGNRMPPFEALPEPAYRRIATYLASLD